MTDTASPTVTQKLDALFQPWNRSDVPGLSVGIARDGEVIYRRGFGLASIEHARANGPAVRMRIGSTTKQFCALGIMLLAEDGRVDIDAPVRRYLPELTNVYGDATLLQLMRHTGGLRDPMFSAFFLNGGVFGHPANGSTLEMLARMREGNFAPGTRMAYCNSGYTLLTLVTERISGQRWEAFMTERVFAPLGMHATALLRSDLDIVPDMATLHYPQADGRWRRGIYPTEELLGSGGMISTVDDMLRWTAHLRCVDRPVGSAATWAKMLERPVWPGGVKGSYGLGLMQDRYRGVATIHHAGAVIGAQCQMLVVPDHALDVVILTNRMDVSAPALALKVLDAVLENELEAIVPPPAAKDHPALQGLWYSRGSRCLMNIAARQAVAEQPEALALTTFNTATAILQRCDRGLAIPDGPWSTLEIRELPAGDTPPASLEVHICGEPESFERLPDEAPQAATLAPRVCGRYREAEFGAEFEIALREDKLVIDLLPSYGRGIWELTPCSAEVFCCGALHAEPTFPLPFTATLAIEYRDGKAVGLWVGTDRVRHVRFDRC